MASRSFLCSTLPNRSRRRAPTSGSRSPQGRSLRGCVLEHPWRSCTCVPTFEDRDRLRRLYLQPPRHEADGQSLCRSVGSVDPNRFGNIVIYFAEERVSGHALKRMQT